MPLPAKDGDHDDAGGEIDEYIGIEKSPGAGRRRLQRKLPVQTKARGRPRATTTLTQQTHRRRLRHSDGRRRSGGGVRRSRDRP